MALTNNCDVFGSFHEDGLNRFFGHLMEQRPSLFNYGTKFFVSNPKRLCREIRVHPEVPRRNNPIVTEEAPLPIPGTYNTVGLNFCLQLIDVRVDLHPGNQFTLPAELSPPIAKQSLAIRAEMCGAIVCPIDTGDVDLDINLDDKRGEPEPLPGRDIQCFCLEVLATAHVEVVGPQGAQKVAIVLDGLEIVDIEPEGLENSIECFIAATLRIAILPRIRPALDTLVFELGEYATLSISPTPLSPAVPNNPAIEDDQLKVFVNVEVGP